MAVSESKRKANEKWDKENMITLGCRVKRTEAEAFKEYARSQGVTANALLKSYVFQCIEEMEKDKADTGKDMEL